MKNIKEALKNIVEKVADLFNNKKAGITNLKKQNHLEEAEKEILKIKKAREEWKAKNPGWSEDEIPITTKILKENRQRLAGLENQLGLTENDAEKNKISKQMDSLKLTIKKEEDDLRKLKEIYEEYRLCSGMLLAQNETMAEKIKRQTEGAKKIAKYWGYFILVILGLTLGLTILIGITFLAVFGAKSWIVFSFFLLPIILITAIAVTFYNGYTEVPEKEEWIIEFQGKFLTIWEAGWHIKFPFFMEIKGMVFMGDSMLGLHMTDQKDQAGKPSAKVDFTDSSAEIIVSIFYRVFDAYAVMYNIDNVEGGIEQKMEAGIRAYYGGQKIDDAIANRAEVDLRKIIIQNATEADIFKSWGIRIVSLAVTDIKLPKEVEEIRNTKLAADKAQQVAQIKQRQEEIEATTKLKIAGISQEQKKVEAKTAEFVGQAEGNRLKKLSEAVGIDVSGVMNFELSQRKFEAYGKASMLVVSDSPQTANGAIQGAAISKGLTTKQTKP